MFTEADRPNIEEQLVKTEAESEEMAKREATPREIADLSVRLYKLRHELWCLDYDKKQRRHNPPA